MDFFIKFLTIVQSMISARNIAQMTFNALGTKMKDSDKTLAEFLGIKMPVTKPQELKVEKVYTENLKEVVVELSNAELVKEGKLTDVKNYKIVGNTVLEAEVVEDSVVLLLDKALVKGRTYEIVLRNIDKAVDKTYKFEAKDNAIPSVVDVKALGEYGILVTTSEPVNNPRERDFKVDGKNIAMDIEQYGRDIVLTPYYDKAFPEDAKELTVEGLVDYAGFKSVKETFEIKVEKDEVAPKVVDVLLKDGNVVEVTFDKDIFRDSVEHYTNRRDLGNISYELGRHTVYAEDSKKIARNKVEYTFKEELSRRTEVTIVGVTNHSLVAMEKTTELVREDLDYTEPEIVKGYVYDFDIDSNKDKDNVKAQIVLEFDKNIKGNFTKPEDHFTLYEREVVARNEVKNAVFTVDKFNKRDDALLVTIDNLNLNNRERDFDYILEVRNFTDTTTIGNRMYRDYVDFDLRLTKPFQVDTDEEVVIVPSYSDRQGREITITFTKPVDRRLAEDGTNYIFRTAGGAIRDLDQLGGEAIVERSGVEVTLSIPRFNQDNYATLELLPKLKDVSGVRISGPRVYTFATGEWHAVGVDPVLPEPNELTEEINGTNVTVNKIAVNPEQADDVLTAPFGSYHVKVTFGDPIAVESSGSKTFIKTNALDFLEVKLLDANDKVVAVNTLNLSKKTEIGPEWDSTSISCPFNIGRSEVHDKWAWTRGTYNGTPTQVEVNYGYRGETYTFTKALTFDTFEPDEKYGAFVIEAANLIAGATEIRYNSTDLEVINLEEIFGSRYETLVTAAGINVKVSNDAKNIVIYNGDKIAATVLVRDYMGLTSVTVTP